MTAGLLDGIVVLDLTRVLAGRQCFPAVPHPARGAVRVTASPYHLDGEPVHPRGGVPYLVGEHTRSVLGQLLGYADERIDALERAGAIGTVPAVVAEPR